MRGLRPDGMTRIEGEPITEDFLLHHIFRLHGIPPHDVYNWTDGQKRYAYNSLMVQLEEEQERLKHGIGRVM